MIPLYVGDEGFLNILIWADSFFHESSNEFNKFCLKVNRTIALFGLTYKSEQSSKKDVKEAEFLCRIQLLMTSKQLSLFVWQDRWFDYLRHFENLLFIIPIII